MRKIETTLQDQSVVIKNLETRVGQMALAMTGKASGTLPSNIEINPKEHAKAIINRSRVQLLEIHVKMLVANKETVHSLYEEHVEQVG